MQVARVSLTERP